jgi:two-component system cell cycle sensor histidine kinase/response regulator CckA
VREAGESKTILVAEDEESVRHAICEFLTRKGFQVIEATDGRAALVALNKAGGRVDAVITDVVMPWLGGGGLVEQMRADGHDIPTLFVSGLVKDTTEFTDGGTDDKVLAKPFTRSQLLAALDDVLAR